MDEFEKREYRKGQGKKCPFCKTGVVIANIATKIINNDLSQQEMMCKNCNKKWLEKYPLFDIEELN